MQAEENRKEVLRLGEILQTSIMVAGIAAALAAILPVIGPPAFRVPLTFGIGPYKIVYPLIPASVLICGMLSLKATYNCAKEIGREAELLGWRLFFSKDQPVCLLCLSITLLMVAFVAILFMMPAIVPQSSLAAPPSS